MSLDLTNEINAMISDRNMSEEQVISLIQDMIKSAYKKKYGTDENCLIEFDESMRKMSVYQIRKVVKEENWYSEFTEIPVERGTTPPLTEKIMLIITSPFAFGFLFLITNLPFGFNLLALPITYKLTMIFCRNYRQI